MLVVLEENSMFSSNLQPLGDQLFQWIIGSVYDPFLIPPQSVSAIECITQWFFNTFCLVNLSGGRKC